MLSGITFMIVLGDSFHHHDQDERRMRTFINWYFVVTGLFFVVLSSALLVMYCMISYKLRKFEAWTMTQRYKTIKAVFAVFAVGYCFHAIVFIFEAFELY